MARSLLLAALLLPLPSAGQEGAIVSAAAELRARARREPSLKEGRVLSPEALAETLGLLAEGDFGGAGAEAAAAAAWAEGRGEAVLRFGPRGFTLKAGGESRALSAGLGNGLSRLAQFTALSAEAPAAGALATAVLSPASVERVAALFERSIVEAMDMRLQTPVPPVLGYTTKDSSRFFVTAQASGQAALGPGGLELVEVPDPARPALRALAAAGCAVDRLEAAFAAHPAGMKTIDDLSGQVLSLSLKRAPYTRSRGVSEEAIMRGLCHNAVTVVVNAAESTRDDAAGLAAALATRSWSGAYLGRFYLKTPVRGDKGWLPGALPGDGRGRSLVFTFQPDGFDAYDSLAPGADKADPSTLPVIRYRAPSWKARFAALH